MLIRRCAILFLEPRETLDFDLELLLQGEAGLRRRLQWFALAPHLEAEIEIDAGQRELLGAIGETQWSERDALEALHPREAIETLLASGLLIADAAPFSAHRERDQKLRDTCWRPLSAAAHFFSRWADIDAGDAARESGLRNTADLAERYGAPPTHFHSRRDTATRIELPRPPATELDRLLSRRTTCRNYDTTRPLHKAVFAHLMNRVFAAQAAVELAPESAAVKKTSPSGGGLHPTEAYVLVQHVEGIQAGLYHYHSGDHVLERLTQPAATPAELRGLALRCVAGQHWFADAHVQVMLGPRFKRSFWKYRNHAKAYRALVLDIGHLSQTLYLSATEFGLGAFITSAINEVEIERAFGLDRLDEGPLAVCGFGWRAGEKVTVEFDPLQEVWK
jgi:putative peptide maturation dehydrogenase